MASPAKLSDLPDRTDVLVVGAGPAGLTMAVSLVQLGVDCVIIDRKPAVAAGSKAAAVEPRAVEYLHRGGVAAPLVEDGIRGEGFTAKDGDRTLLRASYGSLDSPYPYLLLVSQRQSEFPLQQRLQALGGVVTGRCACCRWLMIFPAARTPSPMPRAVCGRSMLAT